MMFPIEESDGVSVDDGIAARFLFHTSRDPREVIGDIDARAVFDHMRCQSNAMVQKSTQYPWLVEAVNSDQFVTFYLRYIQLLCQTSSTDYLTLPKNPAVSGFIRIQMMVWNVTDKLEILCYKLALNEVPYYLFQLLRLPQLHPSVCLTETNARLLVHSSIGVLHNMINHVPNIRALYRKSGGVRVLTLYVAASSTDGAHVADKRSSVHYMSLRTAALLVLSFLVDESENEALHADDSYIVYLLTALDDALNRSPNLYSSKYGYQAEELLIGLQNLAGPDRNKKALIKNDAVKYIESALTIAVELKFPYRPENAAVLPTSDAAIADSLAEKALEFLWSLSFLSDCHVSFTPGSGFRRLFERFATETAWSVSCRRVAQGILWNLPNTPSLSFAVEESEPIASMMAVERQQSRRNGHLMISYQHSTKGLMMSVRDSLLAAGYSVWMDVDYMRGSFVDAMAEGIQQASGLILGLSQAFKNSPHCRQEVKYAYQLGVPLFPLQLEPNFSADGWLGLLLATIIYIPLTHESMLSEAVDELKKQLGDVGHKSRAASQEAVEFSRLLSNNSLIQSYPGYPHNSKAIEGRKTQTSLIASDSAVDPSDERTYERGISHNTSESSLSNLQIPVRPALQRLSQPVVPAVLHSPLSFTGDIWSNPFSRLLSWTSTDVSQWLEQEGLARFKKEFSNVNGSMLVELARWRVVAPESLSISLHRDMNMGLVDQLRLNTALAKIVSAPPTPQTKAPQ